MNTLSIKSMSNQISKKKKRGFTLVELIIVIAIIAILAAIAIPKMGTVRENANIKADIANAKNIHTAAASALIDGDIKSDTKDVLAEVKKKLDAYSPSKVYEGKDFTVNIDENSNITISVEGDKVYPEQTGKFTK